MMIIQTIPAIVTVKELQEILHISKSQALDLIHSGHIEAHRIGKKGWRIFAEDIIEYLCHH